LIWLNCALREIIRWKTSKISKIKFNRD